MLAAIVRASLGHPRIVTALALLDRAAGIGGAARRAFRRVSGFRAAARAGADRGARPRCDASRGSGHAAARGSAGRHREREDGALDLEPGPLGDAGGVRPQRRSLPAAPSGDRAPRRAGGLLPAGSGAPLLSPLSSSMEYLVHFGYTSDRLSAVELRDIVQWIVKPQILAVPGVAQAQIFGGAVRERQIEVDPVKLAAAGLTLDDVVATAKRAHAADRRRLPGNADAAHRDPQRRRRAPRSRPSAGAGRHARGLAACASAMSPSVRDGAEPRFGDALIAGKPGILIETSTQFGANTLDVTRALEERLDALAPALAKQGVEYHPALLRPASFIESAIEKLRNSLLIGAVLVVALLLRDAARLARRAGLLQRHPARSVDHGLDSGGRGLVAQHHDPGRPRGRARRGGRRCGHRRREYPAPPPRVAARRRSSSRCSSAHRSKCAGRCSTRPPRWPSRSCPS